MGSVDFADCIARQRMAALKIIKVGEIFKRLKIVIYALWL